MGGVGNNYWCREKQFADRNADCWPQTAEAQKGRKVGTREEEGRRVGRKQSDWLWARDPGLENKRPRASLKAPILSTCRNKERDCRGQGTLVRETEAHEIPERA